jgi:hypothetical protein
MSQQKSKRPEVAQQLIESLLDDSEEKGRSSSQSGSSDVSDPIYLHNEDSSTVRIDSGTTPEPEFSLDAPPEVLALDPVAQAERTARLQRQARFGEGPESSDEETPPFDGTRPLITQLIHRPDSVPIAKGERNEKPSSNEAGGRSTSGNHPSFLKIEKSKARQPAPVLGGASSRAESRTKEVPGSRVSEGGGFASSGFALKQSETLRIAQNRITELEQELEMLRRENESLATAGETLRRRSDELVSRVESLDSQAREAQRIFDEEKKVLRSQINGREREVSEMKVRLEEMSSRLESNFKKIRVRERELEHRLEIVKMENTTVLSSKDKMILDLKRQLDQLGSEYEFANQKTQEIFSQFKDKQETIRRVVRALRIALTILEGEEENIVPIKKAE